MWEKEEPPQSRAAGRLVSVKEEVERFPLRRSGAARVSLPNTESSVCTGAASHMWPLST